MMLAAHVHILGLRVWAVAAIVAGVWGAIVLGPHLLGRRDRGGDPKKGHAIWVEPLRWPGWFWGMYTVARGLRAGGFEGTFEYFAWQRWWQALLVVPVLTGHLAERAAARLAGEIERRRRENPGAPVYVIGYSAGGFAAVRAVELLPAGVKVASLAVCQAAMDPRYDLSAAMERVEGRTIVTSSALDFVILGAGTLALGGSDGRHGLTMGLTGARPGAGAAAWGGGFLAIRWRPGMLRQGLFGSHLWALAPWFVRDTLCPAMGIGRAISHFPFSISH